MPPVDASSIPDVAPSVDHLLRAVSDRRRREVLQCLADDPVTSLGGLAVDVAGRERADATGPERTVEFRDVRLALHHWHLPLLDDADLLRYDLTNDLVSITDDGAAIADWIGNLSRSDEGVHVA